MRTSQNLKFDRRGTGTPTSADLLFSTKHIGFYQRRIA
jgi:hypothetical protein